MSKRDAMRSDQVVSVRFTLVERRLVEAVAAQQGKLMAHFIRDVLLAKARNDLGDWALSESTTDDDGPSPSTAKVVAMHPP